MNQAVRARHGRHGPGRVRTGEAMCETRGRPFRPYEPHERVGYTGNHIGVWKFELGRVEQFGPCGPHERVGLHGQAT